MRMNYNFYIFCILIVSTQFFIHKMISYDKFIFMYYYSYIYHIRIVYIRDCDDDLFLRIGALGAEDILAIWDETLANQVVLALFTLEAIIVPLTILISHKLDSTSTQT